MPGPDAPKRCGTLRAPACAWPFRVLAHHDARPLSLAQRRRAGRVHRLQRRALRLRRGHGCATGQRHERCGRPQLVVAGIRQSRGGVALPRRVRSPRHADWRRSLNTALVEHAPEVVQAFAARGDEIVAHGHTNAQSQGGFGEARGARVARALPRRAPARHRPCAARLALAVDRRERAHAGSARRDRLPSTRSTGLTTTSPPGWPRAAARRCGRFPIRRN